VIADPGWWLDHLDELTDALATAERIREPEAENAREDLEPQHPSEAEHTWVDLDALTSPGGSAVIAWPVSVAAATVPSV